MTGGERTAPNPDGPAAERERLLKEYARRAREVPAELYAPWNPAAAMEVEERRRVAARMLHEIGVFPRAGDPCLEVGCGSLGWLADLINWGVRETDLHAVDLNAERVAAARQSLPAADLRVCDGTQMPWADGVYRLVITSTVFTSIRDREVQGLLAREITRLIAPSGALLWYDFAYNNPRNRNVRGVSRRRLRALFPGLDGPIRSVTLAPPIARLVAPRSRALAQMLEAVPLLRTHLLAVLVKKEPRA